MTSHPTSRRVAIATITCACLGELTDGRVRILKTAELDSDLQAACGV